MRLRRRVDHGRPPSLAALLVAAAILLAGLPATAASGPATAPAGGPAACADVMPLAQVEAGMVGTGWTVVRGRTPKPFRVEILGVFPDWVAPGRDLIVVELADLPGRHVVEAGGGIWAGMSGSPVYVGDRLVGAVAYGFSDGPSRIGGLTPAADMARLLSYGEPSGGAAGVPHETRLRLSADQRRTLMRVAGADRAEADTFDRLPLPVSVSGVPARGRALLAERLASAGVPAIVTRGSAAVAPTGDSPFVTPVPGGNLAGVIAYGDVTVGAVGTTTWVCGTQALGFGHPLALVGRAAFGAHGATSLAIVKGGAGRSFKLATVGAPAGVLDQDRLAGVRVHLGASPSLIPVIARVEDTDLGVTRVGRTQVTASDWVWYVAPQHAYANMISVTDREGPGTAVVRFAVDGRRANGDPWSVVVTDRLASGMIQYEVASRVDGLLGVLIENGFEPITISRVAVRATVEEAVETAEIRSVAVSRNGGAYRVVEDLRVRPGDRLDLRVRLRRPDGATMVKQLALVVPARAEGFGELTVAAGRDLIGGCEDPEGCGYRGFPGLLRALADGPRSDELGASLVFYGEDGLGAQVSTRVRLDLVVTGYVSVMVETR